MMVNLQKKTQKSPEIRPKDEEHPWPQQTLRNKTSWWFQPPRKILYSQTGHLPQVGVKIKNMRNHHPEKGAVNPRCCFVDLGAPQRCVIMQAAAKNHGIITWVYLTSVDGGEITTTLFYPRDPITLSDDDWGV